MLATPTPRRRSPREPFPLERQAAQEAVMAAQTTNTRALAALSTLIDVCDRRKVDHAIDPYIWQVHGLLTRQAGELLIVQGELHCGLVPPEEE